MKTLSKRTLIAFLLAFALVGCSQKPAEEGAAETTAAKKSPPKPAVVTLSVPAGTALDVRLITGLNSKESKVGDIFEGTIETPVAVNDKTAIPKGAEVTGKVTKAVPSGRLKGRAELWVTLTDVKIGGRSYAISSSTTGQKEGSKATRDVLFIGGGAGAGAAVGGAAGGGKGAGIGAAIGAGAGTAAAMLTGKREIQFPPETVLRFRLEEGLKIQR